MNYLMMFLVVLFNFVLNNPGNRPEKGLAKLASGIEIAYESFGPESGETYC